jgi:hypothetical protein
MTKTLETIKQEILAEFAQYEENGWQEMVGGDLRDVDPLAFLSSALDRAVAAALEEMARTMWCAMNCATDTGRTMKVMDILEDICEGTHMGSWQAFSKGDKGTFDNTLAALRSLGARTETTSEPSWIPQEGTHLAAKDSPSGFIARADGKTSFERDLWSVVPSPHQDS